MKGKGIDHIQRLLPQRYPFLMVDRVLEEGEGWLRALKNVTIGEPYFVGHFPGEPIMPAALILEGMAQTAGLLLASRPDLVTTTAGDSPDGTEPTGPTGARLGYLAAVDRARFRRPVRPGDQLVFEARLLRQRGKFHQVRVVATVEGERAAEAVLSLFLPGAG